MIYSQTKQATHLETKSSISDIQVINNTLYFTVDLGEKGKQRWKNNGVNSIFVAHI